MSGLVVTQARLHELLTDAHRAMAEHRHEWAGAILHVLRRVTADGPAASATPLAAGPAEDALPGPITPAATGGELAPAAPAPAEAAGGTLPRARARSLTPNRGRAGGVWTPERDAALREGWVKGSTAGELLPLLNQLPGATPVASEQAVFARANTLQLRRPKDVAARLLKRAGRMGAARAAALAEAGVTTLGAKPLVWTDERLQLGRELWEQGMPAAEMLPRLNALPATVEISGIHTIRTQAAKQGWVRPEEFVAAKRAAYAERMRGMRRSPAPPPEPELPATSIATPIKPGDEKDDAFDLFAKGASVRAVAEQFAEDIGTVGAWHTEWRQRGAMQEEAAV